MSSEWRIKTLGEICLKITDGAHTSPPTVSNGKPMASVKDLTRFGVNIAKARLIASDDFDSLVKQGCKPEVGDVLIAKDGNTALDTVCTVKHPLDAVLLSSVAILRPDQKQINSDFLKFYLSSSDVIDYLKTNFISGAAIPRVVLRDFKKAEISLPSLTAQNVIVNILNSLEDRIELLHQTNTTLEAIAQALFKSWFVDFEPVHAKQQGRIPEGMDEATAALFPDSFEESELGLVPKGWITSTVEKSFILTMGQSPPGNTYNELNEGLPFFQGRTDFGFRFPTQRIFCSSPTRLAERGDTLVSVRAPVGDLNMALEKCAIGRGVASVREPNGYQSYAFYAIKSLHTHFSNFNGEGTIFGSINKKDFQNIPIVSPSKAIIKAFNDTAVALDARIDTNERMIRSLANIRDTLLPRLISGSLHLTSGIETEELMPNEN